MNSELAVPPTAAGRITRSPPELPAGPSVNRALPVFEHRSFFVTPSPPLRSRLLRPLPRTQPKIRLSCRRKP